MGLLLHAARMVAEDGLPLGRSSLKGWARAPWEETWQEKQILAYRSAMAEKESAQWLEALQERVALLPQESH